MPSNEELLAKLQRPIQQTNDENLSVRRTALQALHDLFVIDLADKLPESVLVSPPSFLASSPNFYQSDMLSRRHDSSTEYIGIGVGRPVQALASSVR